jgi:hypothetical protein
MGLHSENLFNIPKGPESKSLVGGSLSGGRKTTSNGYGKKIKKICFFFFFFFFFFFSLTSFRALHGSEDAFALV